MHIFGTKDKPSAESRNPMHKLQCRWMPIFERSPDSIVNSGSVSLHFEIPIDVILILLNEDSHKTSPIRSIYYSPTLKKVVSRNLSAHFNENESNKFGFYSGVPILLKQMIVPIKVELLRKLLRMHSTWTLGLQWMRICKINYWGSWTKLISQVENIWTVAFGSSTTAALNRSFAENKCLWFRWALITYEFWEFRAELLWELNSLAAARPGLF